MSDSEENDPHIFEVDSQQTLEALQRGDCRDVRTLYIDYSVPITSFLPALLQLPKLQLLNIRSCAMVSLPENLGQFFPKLQLLTLMDCGFTAYPASLQTCPRLRSINLSHNNIHSIPGDAITSSLMHLNLTDNRIEFLPNSIGNCADLTECRLSQNKLRRLPCSMKRCKRLTTLRISCNEFESLPAWLFRLPKLAYLTFAGNPCSSYGPIDYPPCPPNRHWVYLDAPQRPISSKNTILNRQELGQTPTSISYEGNFLRPGGRAYNKIVFRAFVGECIDAGTPQNELAAHLKAGQHPNLVSPIAVYRGDLEGGWPFSAGEEDSGQIDHDFHGGIVMQRIAPGYRVLTAGRIGQPYPSENYSRLPIRLCLLSVEECVLILHSVADAAWHLHNKGIAHGDLVGHNVYHNKHSAHTLLVDFGAATVYTHASMEDLAPYVERVEVCAFGRLLEHVMQLFNPWCRWRMVVDPPGELDDQAVATWRYERHVCDELKGLRERCLDKDVGGRPGFWEIQRELMGLADGYQWIRDSHAFRMIWTAGEDQESAQGDRNGQSA